MAMIKTTRKLAACALVFALWMLNVTRIDSRVSSPQAERPTASIAKNEGAFLLLSDIHFDPFTATDPAVIKKLVHSPVSQWSSILLASLPNQAVAPDGADANYALLASALAAARDSGVTYDYVLVAGDLLGHNFVAKSSGYFKAGSPEYHSFVIKTMSFVSGSIQKSFPSARIYYAFGNNDSILDDYAPPGNRLLSAMAKDWKTVPRIASAKRDFLTGGYYAVPHPTVPGAELIILNTSYWTSHDSPAPLHGEDDAELKWLAAQLDRLQRTHRTAVLLMHIPPGIDANASAKPGHCVLPTFFWKKSVQDSFLSLVASHKSVLRDAFAGHTHANDFRVLSDDKGLPYFQVHIAAGLSRDHHTPPGFETIVYDKKSAAMVDYAADYEHDPASAGSPATWAVAYDFRQESHLPSYSPGSLETVALLIRSSDVIRSRVMRMAGVQNNSGLSAQAQDWRFYSCAQTNWDAGAFSKCACPAESGAPQPPEAAVPRAN